MTAQAEYTEHETVIRLSPSWGAVLISVLTAVVMITLFVAGQPSREESRDIARQEIAPLQVKVDGMQTELIRLNRNIEKLLDERQSPSDR